MSGEILHDELVICSELLYNYLNLQENECTHDIVIPLFPAPFQYHFVDNKQNLVSIYAAPYYGTSLTHDL